MSKKNKKSFTQIQESGAAQLHVAEYKIIKHDLLKVLILNIVYLAGVLALYYSNAKTHYLERLFEKFLRF
jgi:hypothetical protein